MMRYKIVNEKCVTVDGKILEYNDPYPSVSFDLLETLKSWWLHVADTHDIVHAQIDVYDTQHDTIIELVILDRIVFCDHNTCIPVDDEAHARRLAQEYARAQKIEVVTFRRDDRLYFVDRADYEPEDMDEDDLNWHKAQVENNPAQYAFAWTE